MSLIEVEITGFMDLETTHYKKANKREEVRVIHEEKATKVDADERNETINCKVELDDNISENYYDSCVHDHEMKDFAINTSPPNKKSLFSVYEEKLSACFIYQYLG